MSVTTPAPAPSTVLTLREGITATVRVVTSWVAMAGAAMPKVRQSINLLLILSLIIF